MSLHRHPKSPDEEDLRSWGGHCSSCAAVYDFVAGVPKTQWRSITVKELDVGRLWIGDTGLPLKIHVHL
ncbi:hypothetical protein L2E82_39234 [Cichorium intybus]|uniref:Uncharacterized protein n=1 Tax=Cichorium intybus TaxID=13427 RepID=A0ACB9AH51_CICIN|nr:hypothetical protein L2E82_39234 [Cichorium intybus]